jgi:hypothetical protein
MRLLSSLFLGCALVAGSCAAQITVPSTPPTTAAPQGFKDSHFGVRFEVPAGWSLSTRDGLVSTFHNDARSASAKAKVRGVASMDFNPFPYSTFSGALFYYSVTRHAKDEECARQATPPDVPASAQDAATDVQDIGGMKFTHGHDEHGDVCVEARDEVYTAYRKGSCYRFDLEINTFCAVSSGAEEITDGQVESLNQRMANILSTVVLGWSKTGAHPVAVPATPAEMERPAPKPVPKQQTAEGKATLAER